MTTGRLRSLLPAIVALAGLASAAEQVSGLQVFHRKGQTFILWREVNPPVTAGSVSAAEIRKLLRQLARQRKLFYRIYRSERPITSLEGLEPLAEAPPLSCWDADYYGIYPKPNQMAPRYVVQEGKAPLAPGTGLYVHNPAKEGKACYAVTVVRDGAESRQLGPGNCLPRPVPETVGQGEPLLQRVVRPTQFMYVRNPTLHYFVRWEAPPNCAEENHPYDYLVAIPPKPANPAPVGIHLHCWGGSLNGGYGWWYNAERGHFLLASNQIPYDWWTGYHELYFRGPAKRETWQKGRVHPYTTRRLLSFLDWMTGRWKIDLKRTHTAGNSMGGSGSPMFAIRYPDRVAWAISWVGVHIPHLSPHFKGSYERVYGKPDWGVEFEDGTAVWDHYNDASFLRTHPEKEIGLIIFSNAKNDRGIGWKQAVLFLKALQETRRPHVFVWGQSGHGQRARMPVTLGERILEIDVRTDLSLPAFTSSSLDDDPGSGDPAAGDPKGQVNLYLYWKTDDIVDERKRWEMTVGIIDKAPQDSCTTDLTPRRCQAFRPEPGTKLPWTNKDLKTGQTVQRGVAAADKLGLVTLKAVQLTKAPHRISISR